MSADKPNVEEVTAPAVIESNSTVAPVPQHLDNVDLGGVADKGGMVLHGETVDQGDVVDQGGVVEVMSSDEQKIDDDEQLQPLTTSSVTRVIVTELDVTEDTSSLTRDVNGTCHGL